MQHRHTLGVHAKFRNFLPRNHPTTLRYQHDAVVSIGTQVAIRVPDNDQIARSLDASAGIHHVSARCRKNRVTDCARDVDPFGELWLKRRRYLSLMGPRPAQLPGIGPSARLPQ